MSLSVALKLPEGMVLAVDSRLTLQRARPNGCPELCFVDGAAKLWRLPEPNAHIVASFYGGATAGVRTAGSLVAEFRAEQGTVEAVAGLLGAHLLAKGLREASLCVAGFDETAPYGRMFEVALTGSVRYTVRELHSGGSWGASLGGKRGVATALLDALSPPYSHLPVAAGAELAAWLIEVTARAQGYAFGLPTVGGAARVAVLKRGEAPQIEVRHA